MSKAEITSSVLIASYQRPETLIRGLVALDQQTVIPDEVLVIWQADDTATRDAVRDWANRVDYALKAVHCAELGIVPAENAGLAAATGDLIFLIDDDATAPPDWVERHCAHYADPAVGAVGGPANNHRPGGELFPKREVTPIGKLTWYGRLHGNMHDLPDEWRNRAPFEVDHLVGYNFSLRANAIAGFESRLRRYWQMFEAEACLQVKSRGLRVIFDPAIVVDHFPTNPTYTNDRAGDLEVKVANAGYNQAFILGKHSPGWLALPRLLYHLLIGTVATPGPALLPLTWRRFGDLGCELKILSRAARAKWHGWTDGFQARRPTPPDNLSGKQR